jgi:predicted NUDIX family NTP pyrophosphohydrolase
MPSRSAGILAYRRKRGAIEVLLVHPGGPFWRKKDVGAWSIPKGEYGPDEDPEDVARREFKEELGIELDGEIFLLGEVRQRAGKTVRAFAIEADIDVQNVKSNTFEIEWPPRSGHRQAFPEIDRAEWFDLTSAHTKVNAAQRMFLEQLEAVGAVGAKR